jgi:hypothetical protein
MTQLQLPRVDADALVERLREVDLSRLADLGDEIRRLDLPEAIRGLDVDALRRVDLDALRHLDVDTLRHLAESVDRPDIDLAALRDSELVHRVQRAIGRGPKRNLWEMYRPSTSATVVAGTVIVIGGAVVGGLIAWLFQPGKGEARRALIRRKVGRAIRKVQRRLSPA